MGDRGQGQESPGGAQAMGILLPLATLAAGIVRPQTAPAMAAVAQQGHYMNQQQAAQAEAERKAAGQEATAQSINSIFNVPVSGKVDASTNLGLLNAQDARARFQAEEEGRRFTRADTRENQDAWGRIGTIRQGVGSGPAEALETSVRNLQPNTIRNPETFKGLEDTQKSISDYAKRLSDADAAVRGTQGGPGLPGVPLPENVAAFRSHVMASGVPKPEDAAMQFGVPIEQLPGGLAAQREAVTPKHAPTIFKTENARGETQANVVAPNVQTGQYGVQQFAVPGPGGGPAGQPQPVQWGDMAAIARSMQAVISGQPNLAMPQDRGMTPQTAAAVLTSLRAVNAAMQAQASPDLAFKVISDQRDTTAASVKRLKSESQSKQGTVQTRQQALSALEVEQKKLEKLDAMMTPFIQSGMRNLPGGPPPAPTTPMPGGAPDRTKKLQEQGVITP